MLTGLPPQGLVLTRGPETIGAGAWTGLPAQAVVLNSGAGAIGVVATAPKSQEKFSVEGAGAGLTAAKMDVETRGSGLVIRDSSDPNVGGTGFTTLAGKEGTAIDAVELSDVGGCDAEAQEDVVGGG